MYLFNKYNNRSPPSARKSLINGSNQSTHASTPLTTNGQSNTSPNMVNTNIIGGTLLPPPIHLRNRSRSPTPQLGNKCNVSSANAVDHLQVIYFPKKQTKNIKKKRRKLLKNASKKRVI